MENVKNSYILIGASIKKENCELLDLQTGLCKEKDVNFNNNQYQDCTKNNILKVYQLVKETSIQKIKDYVVII